MRKTIIAIAVVGAGFGLAACGTAATPAAAPAAPVTVTVAPPSDVPALAAPVAPAPTQAPAAAAAAPATDAPAPVKVPMPDVVGMNLQAAQDKMQEAGVSIPAARTRPEQAGCRSSTPTGSSSPRPTRRAKVTIHPLWVFDFVEIQSSPTPAKEDGSPSESGCRITYPPQQLQKGSESGHWRTVRWPPVPCGHGPHRALSAVHLGGAIAGPAVYPSGWRRRNPRWITCAAAGYSSRGGMP